MEAREKIAALCGLARELNRLEVTWAVGGSLMLWHHGIVNDFHDVDILFAEEDAARVMPILDRVGIRVEKPQSENFRSTCFFSYTIRGVEFDFIAGFAIVWQGQVYRFPLKRQNIAEYAVFDDVRIPLQSVAEWKTFYALMGRTAKVERIEQWMHGKQA